MSLTIPQPRQTRPLDSSDHGRDSSGMTYVYPVVSRRAGGVSVGINLNPNNACNWRCIYCQVPNLTRGGAPSIDLALLEIELRTMLRELLHGEFMSLRVPEDSRRIEDIAFSGNGEPTSSRDFLPAIDVVTRLMDEFNLLGRIKLRLITNGSLIGKPAVRQGIVRLSQANGEVWFKLDAGTRKRIALVNGADIEPASVIRRLNDCSSICATWGQTCCFALDGFAPSEMEIASWLDVLGKVKESLEGVHLYGLARHSMQAEAPRLACLPQAWLEKLADRVRQLGLSVRISP
ncbi:MAG: radical SAM protein [Sterolibacterium sp.]|nr:radical SAM protein [Sterolibacterium sp.]